MKIIQGIVMLLITTTVSYWGKKDADKAFRNALKDSQKKVSADIPHLKGNDPVINIYDPSLNYADKFNKENNRLKKITIEKPKKLNGTNFYNGGNAGN